VPPPAPEAVAGGAGFASADLSRAAFAACSVARRAAFQSWYWV
jgi:hypothetical protein